MKINISYITSNDFHRIVFVMPTSKHKYQCFLILVQSFSACTFSRVYALIDWLFPIQTFISWVIRFPFKWPRQEAKTKQQQLKQNDIHSNKKPRVFANKLQSANKTLFGTLSQGLGADWLVCIAHCIFWHLIGSDQLSYFSYTGQFACL